MARVVPPTMADQNKRTDISHGRAKMAALPIERGPRDMVWGVTPLNLISRRKLPNVKGYNGGLYAGSTLAHWRP